MGSLNTRWYVKFLGGESKVDEWVSLGGPNHGTDTANACFSKLIAVSETVLDSVPGAVGKRVSSEIRRLGRTPRFDLAKCGVEA